MLADSLSQRLYSWEFPTGILKPLAMHGINISKNKTVSRLISCYLRLRNIVRSMMLEERPSNPEMASFQWTEIWYCPWRNRWFSNLELRTLHRRMEKTAKTRMNTPPKITRKGNGFVERWDGLIGSHSLLYIITYRFGHHMFSFLCSLYSSQ